MRDFHTGTVGSAEIRQACLITRANTWTNAHPHIYYYQHFIYVSVLQGIAIGDWSCIQTDARMLVIDPDANNAAPTHYLIEHDIILYSGQLMKGLMVTTDDMYTSHQSPMHG